MHIFIRPVLKITEWLVFLVLIFLFFIILSPVLPIQGLPRTFIVVSGSMEPTIKTGSIAFTQAVDSKKVSKDDIVAFTSPSNPKDTILHRVTRIVSTEPLLFETKGDNNNAPDNWSVMDVGIKGKYIFSIPYLGHAGAFVRKPLGFGLVVGIPAILFIISQLINIKKAIAEEVNRRVAQTLKSKKKSKPTQVSIKSLILSIGLFSALTGLSTLKAVKASFSDTLTVDGIVLTVKDFVPPSTPQNLHWSNPNVACGGYTNSASITANWDVSTDNVAVTRYEYHITYPKIGGGIGVWNTFTTQPFYSGTFNQAEGLHIFKIRSYDAEGNVSPWSANCSITYDSTVPESTITHPFNSNGDNKIQYTYIWNGKAEGAASDNLSGVDRVELSIYRSLLDLYWNGSAWVHGSESGTRVQAVGTSTWSYQFNNQPPLGRFRIIAHAIDRAGNVENSSTIEFENLEVPSLLTATPSPEPTTTTIPTISLSSSYLNHRIYLNINHIPTTFGQNTADSINYEIKYTNSIGDQGFAGSVGPSGVTNQTISRDFLLGTCSEGGTCLYDIGIGESASIILTGQINDQPVKLSEILPLK